MTQALKVLVEHEADDPAQLLDRAAAMSAGHVRYRGSLCPRCGHGERYVANSACVRCAYTTRHSRSVAAKEAKRAAGMEALKRLGLR